MCKVFAALRVGISLVCELSAGFAEAIALLRVFIAATCKAFTRMYVPIEEQFMASPTVTLASPRLSMG